MLFAALILEREPLSWWQLPAVTVMWLQSAGAIAALGLAIMFAVRGFSLSKLFSYDGRPVPAAKFRTLLAIASWACYGLVVALYIGSILQISAATSRLPASEGQAMTAGDWILAVAGLLAAVVVAFPVLRSLLVEVRVGRVWAIAKLSIKESIRNRSIAIFGVMALIFLFAQWFLPPPANPADQVRNYVWVLTWTMLALFLLAAGLYGSFSIPNDIKNLTIHTVVTKPITKFEVVLGRFFGYGLLLTVSLFVVGLLSMGYIVRGVTDEAKKESFVARVPVYGGLGFINTKGDSVGREWDYRRYIAGTTMSGGKRQYGVWFYPDLSDVRPNEDGMVRLEFSFDIFRLTKGDENKGVLCTFKFADGRTPIEKVESMLEERRQERIRRMDTARKDAGGAGVDFNKIGPKIDAELLKQFPVYEEAGVEVIDYRTLKVEVPYALIERLRQVAQSAPPAGPGEKSAEMCVYVNIDPDRGSAAQMLGVAPRDLYILADEKGFFLNFFKGLVGLWFLTLLVLGVAVCCSTYLSGVISLQVTLFLLLAGFFMPSISQMANNQTVGGGPAEAFQRMVVLRSNMVAPLEESATTSLIRGVDALFRFVIRLVLMVIPDASRYDLHPYVANGFDISVGRVLFLDNLLPLLAYLIPWFILAYYLINYREIANPT